MKRILAGLCITALIAVTSVISNMDLISKAEAAPNYLRSMASVDAGPTVVGAITGQGTFEIECTQPACFKTGTSSSTLADCATAYILPSLNAGVASAQTVTGNTVVLDAGANNLAPVSSYILTLSAGVVPTLFGMQFESGGHLLASAQQLDAGTAPGCKLYQVVKNVAR